MPNVETTFHLLVQRNQDGALAGKPRRYPATALPMASPTASALHLYLQVFLGLSFICVHTLLFRLAAPISSLNLVKGSLDLFQVLLQEALPNLKERKYLRGWIQVSSIFAINFQDIDSLAKAGVVYACIWSLGGCLADEGERAKFDQSIREVTFFIINIQVYRALHMCAVNCI